MFSNSKLTTNLFKAMCASCKISRRQHGASVLETYYPGAMALLRERGVQKLAPITVYYPMVCIAERLGFRPQ
jgi:hypothetical protein